MTRMSDNASTGCSCRFENAFAFRCCRAVAIINVDRCWLDGWSGQTSNRFLLGRVSYQPFPIWRQPPLCFFARGELEPVSGSGNSFSSLLLRARATFIRPITSHPNKKSSITPQCLLIAKSFDFSRSRLVVPHLCERICYFILKCVTLTDVHFCGAENEAETVVFFEV